MKNIIYFLGIMIFIGSCSDDDLEICDTSNCIATILCEPDTCFTVYDGNWTGDFTSSDTSYNDICFNPNNKDEFVTLRLVTHYDNPVPYTTWDLVKYNILTNEATVLRQTSGINMISWYKNHIYYTVRHAEAHLRRINTDGTGDNRIGSDNLIIETFNIIDDNTILAKQGEQVFTIDHQGNILDEGENTIDGILSPDRTKIARFDMTTQSITIDIYDDTSRDWNTIFHIKESVYGDFIWSKDNQYIYWTDKLGLQRLHLATRKVETVRTNCHNDLFLQLAVDSQDNLYAVRQTGKVVNNPEPDEYFEKRLVRFDFNYCEVIDVTPF